MPAKTEPSVINLKAFGASSVFQCFVLITFQYLLLCSILDYHINKYQITKNSKNKMAEFQKCDLRETASTIDSVINIYGGPDIGASEVIDKFNANEPETFTLEEYRNILLEFRKNNKDCIIAKVTIPENAHYNYYLASEINKLLFKFERDRRLLHRMKVRNPLNNQYIIGPVYYYKISCFDIDRAIVECFFSTEKEEGFGKRTTSEVVKKKPKHEYDTKKATSETDERSNISQSLMDESPWTLIDDVKNGNLKLPNKRKDKIYYSAVYFASDDDFLMRADTREYFRVNSMDPAEEFLFELDRTHNDLFALLDTTSDSTDEDIVGWKRVLAIHMSVLITMLGVVILLGANPLILIVAFPLAVLTLISFLCSLLYIMVFRRDTFGSLAVRSMEDV